MAANASKFNIIEVKKNNKRKFHLHVFSGKSENEIYFI